MAQEIVARNGSVTVSSSVQGLLSSIRPEWQAKSLIERVRALIGVDPSSACQRILNASIHDLRTKIVIAGVDIAAEVADKNKLPPVKKSEDLENYSSFNTVNLAYHMGLVDRSGWKRLLRSYDIRRDLEHEDDTYEAGLEDVIYVFKTAIEVVLSKEPITLVRVIDFKEIIEDTASSVLSEALLEDFSQAPQSRQEEIAGFLMNVAMDKDRSDLVQQNAVAAIVAIEPLMHKQAKAGIGQSFQAKVGRQMSERQARVATAMGIMPYIRNAARVRFFTEFYDKMERVGSDWSAYSEHADLLDAFDEVGALDNCPEEVRPKIIEWLIKTFIGTPGGRTSYGNIRNVYYSNSASPRIRRIFKNCRANVLSVVKALKEEKAISSRLENKHVARRFEEIVDILEAGNEEES